MVTAVYLSDESVQVLVGKTGRKQIEITEAFQKELPPGSISNGNIISEETVSEVLSNIWKEHGLSGKHVRVVVNASPITLKKFELPAVKKKELRQLVRREMGGQSGDEIIDYMRRPAGGKRISVYAAAGQKDYLLKYQRVFQKAGIKPDKLLPSRICLEKVLSHMKVLSDKPCIVQILEGTRMTSVLWVDKEAVYAMRTNIPGEYGSFQFGLEVSRAVSNLLQFYMTQEKHQEIRNVYLSGITEKDFLICEEAISQMTQEVEAERLERDESITEHGNVQMPFGNYLRLAGVLFEQRSEINLLPSGKKEKVRTKRSDLWKYAELPLILTLGCGAITAALVFSNHLKQTVLEDVNTYVNDPVNIQKCGEADTLEQENLLLSNHIEAVEYMNQVIASYPAMNSSVVEEIQRCAEGKAEVSVQSYLAQEGLLTLDVTAPEADLCSQLVETLQDSGLFQRIDYTGYVYSEAEMTYHVNILCYLQESAGKEEVEEG